MGNYKEITGNLITLAHQGLFDVIVQGNNCFCTQGSGLAPQMVKAFGTDKFPMEDLKYKGDMNKLGTVDYKVINVPKITPIGTDFGGVDIFVVNCYTQYFYGQKFGPPVDYEAVTMCMRKINHIFKGKRIGLPLIGCGLAGGLWSLDSVEERDKHLYSEFLFVRDIIQTELKDMDITVVNYEG